MTDESGSPTDDESTRAKMKGGECHEEEEEADDVDFRWAKECK